MNFKENKPALFGMMAAYYQLMQKLYGVVDIKQVIRECDTFLNEWLPQLEDRDHCVVEGLTQGILVWKDIEIKEGKK